MIPPCYRGATILFAYFNVHLLSKKTNCRHFVTHQTVDGTVSGVLGDRGINVDAFQNRQLGKHLVPIP